MDQTSRTCSGAPPILSTRFCVGPSRPTSQSSSRPNSISSSICSPLGRSASPSRPLCSPAPMRRSNAVKAEEAVVGHSRTAIRLLMVGSYNAINATLYAKLNYNFIRDIAPVAGVIRQPLVMVVHPSFPAKTVPEFIAHAKANPGKINMASPGIGSTPHLVGALFKALANVDIVHVAYRQPHPPSLTY